MEERDNGDCLGFMGNRLPKLAVYYFNLLERRGIVIELLCARTYE